VKGMRPDECDRMAAVLDGVQIANPTAQITQVVTPLTAVPQSIQRPSADSSLGSLPRFLLVHSLVFPSRGASRRAGCRVTPTRPCP